MDKIKINLDKNINTKNINIKNKNITKLHNTYEPNPHNRSSLFYNDKLDNWIKPKNSQNAFTEMGES